jgi:hypothetical protein
MAHTVHVEGVEADLLLHLDLCWAGIGL